MSNVSRVRHGARRMVLLVAAVISFPVCAAAQIRDAAQPQTQAAAQTAAGTSAAASSGQAAAPATRAEALRAEREAKQRAATPYKRNGLESAMHFAEEEALLILTREGFYPKLGSLTTGSGFTAGVGYRNSPIFKRHGTLDIYAAGSLKKYWALEALATFPQLADGHLFAQLHAGRRAYPQEDYFGLGPDALRGDHVSFALTTNTYGGRVGVRPAVRSPLMVGGGVELVQPVVGAGKDKRVPSIEARFTDLTAPGLAQQPDFLKSTAFVDFDYRRPTYARNGGWYRVDFSHYADRDLDAYSFKRVDVDLRQFVGFFAERRVLAGRVFYSTSDADADQQVPFYLMPYLGGNDTLRGFREYRFRGPHALLMQAEYHFEIWSGLDMAFFYDTGKVALRREDLRLKNLEKDYGFGFRFNTDEGVVVRVDAGFGSRDGKHLYITFGGVF